MSTDFELGAKALKKWGAIAGGGLWLLSLIITIVANGLWVLPFFLITIYGSFLILFLIVNTVSDIASAFKYVSLKERDPRHYSVVGATASTLYWVNRIEEIGAKIKEKGNA